MGLLAGSTFFFAKKPHHMREGRIHQFPQFSVIYIRAFFTVETQISGPIAGQSF
jgi:hypothetical protein